MKQCVIFDFDGVFTRTTWPNSKHCPEIKTAFARHPHEEDRVIEDRPRSPIIKLAHILRASGVAVVIATGRSEAARSDTERWLRMYGVPFDELHMRTVEEWNARVSSAQVKRRFDADITSRYDVMFVFDDRDADAAMWRSLGHDCYQTFPVPC